MECRLRPSNRSPVAAAIDRVVGVNRAQQERDRARRRATLEHYRKEASRHFDTLRLALAATGGTEIKGTGDGRFRTRTDLLIAPD